MSVVNGLSSYFDVDKGRGDDLHTHRAAGNSAGNTPGAKVTSPAPTIPGSADSKRTPTDSSGKT